MKELQALFDAGNAEELVRLGTEKFRTGEEETAFAYYRAACKLGHAVAMGNLGYCYQTGRGVRADQRMALYCFERAAELDDVGSLLKLGDFCYSGKGGLSRDYPRAFGCYLRAYEILTASPTPDTALFAELCYRLGVCKKEGRGTAQNLQDAYEYFQATSEAVWEDAEDGSARAGALMQKSQRLMEECESNFE